MTSTKKTVVHHTGFAANALLLAYLSLLSACHSGNNPDNAFTPAQDAFLAGTSTVVADKSRLDDAIAKDLFAASQRTFLQETPSPDGNYIARLVTIGAGAESSSAQIVIVAADSVDSETSADPGNPANAANTANTANATQMLDEEAINVGDLRWSPDSRYLAWCEGSIVQVATNPMKEKLVQRRLYTGTGGLYPGTCRQLEWLDKGNRLSFIELQHAFDEELANPQRVVLSSQEKAREH